MTSDTVEELANHDRIASPDMDLQKMLRTSVMQDFMLDVGDVTWRREITSLTMTVASKDAMLPDNFFKMLNMVAPAPGASFVGWDRDKLKYIGEDDLLLARATFNTTPGRPGAYWIVKRGIVGPPVDDSFRAVRFDAPADYAYTVYYNYLTGPVFQDYSTPADLNAYLPEMFQTALVKRLRMEIYLARYGQRDTRYGAEKDRYQLAMDRCLEHSELGRANHMKFVS